MERYDCVMKNRHLMQAAAHSGAIAPAASSSLTALHRNSIADSLQSFISSLHHMAPASVQQPSKGQAYCLET